MASALVRLEVEVESLKLEAQNMSFDKSSMDIGNIRCMIGISQIRAESFSSASFQLCNDGWFNRYYYSPFNAKVERSDYALDLKLLFGVNLHKHSSCR